MNENKQASDRSEGENERLTRFMRRQTSGVARLPAIMANQPRNAQKYNAQKYLVERVNEMSHDHDHDGPCISVEPVRAFEIAIGDMLAAPGGGMPRVCLVTFAERSETGESDTVTLNVLDARIWETNEGELNDACLEFDALNIVGRVVLHDHS